METREGGARFDNRPKCEANPCTRERVDDRCQLVGVRIGVGNGPQPVVRCGLVDDLSGLGVQVGLDLGVAGLACLVEQGRQRRVGETRSVLAGEDARRLPGPEARGAAALEADLVVRAADGLRPGRVVGRNHRVLQADRREVRIERRGDVIPACLLRRVDDANGGIGIVLAVLGRRGEQFRGLVRIEVVVLELRVSRVEARVDPEEPAGALEDGREECLAVEREVHCLAHPRIRHLLAGGHVLEGHLADAGHLHGLDAGSGLEDPEVRRLELEHETKLAALQLRGRGFRADLEAVEDLGDLRRAKEVVRVGRELHDLVRREGGERVRTGADDALALVVVVLAQRRAVEGGQDVLWHDHVRRVSQVLEEHGVRRLERELHGVRVHGLDGLGRIPRGDRVGAVGHVDLGVLLGLGHGEDHVVRGHRLAVAPLRALVEVEGERGRVRRDVPGFGKARDDLFGRVALDEAVVEHLEDGELAARLEADRVEAAREVVHDRVGELATAGGRGWCGRGRSSGCGRSRGRWRGCRPRRRRAGPKRKDRDRRKGHDPQTHT